MLSQESVVCTFFKLPPEEQSLCRIREIPDMFLYKLDYLNLVAVALQEVNALSQVKGEVDGLRKAAGSLCQTLSGAISITRDFATSSIQFADSLQTPQSPMDESFQYMSSISSRADLNAKELDKAHKEMNRFSSNIRSVFFSIKSSLEPRGRWSLDIVPTAEVSEVVDELIAGVEECDRLLLGCAEYYRQTKKHYGDVETLKSNPPSKEEVEMVRQRWAIFSDSLENLPSGFTRLRRRLEKIPTVRRLEDGVPDTWPDDASSVSGLESGGSEGSEDASTTHRQGFPRFWGSSSGKSSLRRFWLRIKSKLHLGA
ncbi:hypothetical protein P691DRAFT_773989 [Macrolepiota fuliginosa MF-IS2]|uniref:Uncharacterized protein n=1 Tax=Macrolepiota fuliginosa MF-IS2 TaxID=1400762 RepID=A0A9P6C5Z9_9AGAR|nr:hypothetical protein P691DRAFT_773989 [Macrolepiota fuliginosa MF-IS2]